MSIVIKSKQLEVRLLSPSSPPFSVRFDSSAVVEQVTLNGRHTFCVPEQILPRRKTCGGVGLCGEFVWNDIAKEAGAGQTFPKPGVGLLTQTDDSLPFQIYHDYEVEPYQVEVTEYPDRVIFEEKPRYCLGSNFLIVKEIRVEQNRLILHTTIENHSRREMDLEEYQHNFIAIDNLPFGPGYRLRIPFDGTIAEIQGNCFPRGAREPVDDAIHTEEDVILWDRPMTNQELIKVTQEKDIRSMGHYWWTLSHTASHASVTESLGFAPTKMVLWGIEHCVCPEVYTRIRLRPGERTGWTRTWIFRDEACPE